MKRLLAAFIVLLLVMGAAALALDRLLEPGVRMALERLGPQVAGVEVTLRSFTVSPFTGRLRLRGLVIGNPKGYKTRSAMELGEVRVALSLRSLLSDTVIVKEVVVRGASATYELGPGGNNLGVIGRKVESFSASSPPNSKDGSTKNLIVRQFRFEGGRLRFSAALMGGKAFELPVPDVHLEDIGGAKGTSPAKAGAQMLGAVTASVGKTALGAAKALAEQVGSAAKTAGKVLGGIKKLFK
ncbi:MAG: hypothetical protein HYZ75_12575 [Elusimicrobia bacterium]|nr:hypothetical protein [Elusimicrobiota bacterium]